MNWSTSSEGGSALVAGAFDHDGEQIKINIGYQLNSTNRYAGPAPDDQQGRKLSPTVRKQIRVSRVKRTATELVGIVNAVLFSAEDMQLVYGAPSLRRRYLDILISQISQMYLKTLQRYQRVLQQRNRLLKMIHERKAGEDELGFWDEQLITEGSWITTNRHQALASLAELCNQEHVHLTGDSEHLTLDYQPSVMGGWSEGTEAELKTEFRKALDESRRREIQRGSTEVGPHRDDLKLWVDGVDMGAYASRGQARTLALALRLGEAAFLSSARGYGPIVLLDDVLSELDSFRRGKVLTKAVQYPQALITTSDADTVQGSFLKNVRYLTVENGSVF